MAVTQRLQDASGVIASDEIGNILIAAGKTADKPAEGSSGYSPGCIFIDTQTGKVYVNVDVATPNVLNLDIIGSITS